MEYYIKAALQIFVDASLSVLPLETLLILRKGGKIGGVDCRFPSPPTAMRSSCLDRKGC